MRVEVSTKYKHLIILDEGGIISAPFGDELAERSNMLYPTKEGWMQIANYALEQLNIDRTVFIQTKRIFRID